MISNPSTPSAISLEKPGSQSQSLAERDAEPPSAINHASLPPGATRRSRMGWFWWLIMAGLASGAWYSQSAWRPGLEQLTSSMPWLERLLPNSKEPEKKKPPVIPVSTAVVGRRDVPLYLNGLGTVTAFKTVTLRSRVEGELINVPFTEGQDVKKGDLIAEIDPRPFKVQRDLAEGQLARDEAILKTAKLTLSRFEGLLPSKSITAQQIDEQALIVQQTVAAIQSDQALVDNAQLQLDYCQISAPISGRIGLRLVDKGNIVRANDPTGLAVITQLQPIALVFTVPQDDIADVKRRSDEVKRLSNGKEDLPVEAFDRDLRRKLATGKLLAIDNQVDATTGTVRLKAVFDNEDGLLFPNQFVNARLLVDTKRDTIVVPSAAVQHGPDSMYVYVVTSDNTVEKRNVVPVPTDGGESSIETGLTPGETVVTDGLDKLQPKAKVAPRKANSVGNAENEGKDGENSSTDKESERPKDSGPSPKCRLPDSTPKPHAPPTDQVRPQETADRAASVQPTADKIAADHPTPDQGTEEEPIVDQTTAVPSKGRAPADDGQEAPAVPTTPAASKAPAIPAAPAAPAEPSGKDAP